MGLLPITRKSVAAQDYRRSADNLNRLSTIQRVAREGNIIGITRVSAAKVLSALLQLLIQALADQICEHWARWGSLRQVPEPIIGEHFIPVLSARLPSALSILKRTRAQPGANPGNLECHKRAVTCFAKDSIHLSFGNAFEEVGDIEFHKPPSGGVHCGILKRITIGGESH